MVHEFFRVRFFVMLYVFVGEVWANDQRQASTTTDYVEIMGYALGGHDYSCKPHTNGGDPIFENINHKACNT